MKKTFSIILLLIAASCGQKSNDPKHFSANDSLSLSKQEKANNTSNTEKHLTSNTHTPDVPTDLKSFIPTGYSALNISSGDANLDGLSDYILVLKKNAEETTSDETNDKPDKRPLLLLLQQSDNTYHLTVRNDNAVLCIDCGGMDGDPFTGITIKNGYFSIETGIAGGPQHWQEITTFKYDKATKNWNLYKDHFINYEMNPNESDTAEALIKTADSLKTVKEFGSIPFEKYNAYNERGY